MMEVARDTARDVRYQPDEHPPRTLAAGMGLQAAVLVFAGIVLPLVIVVRAAGGSETHLAWMVFTALAVRGAATVFQTMRLRRFGSGHMLLTDTSGAFIAICVTALVEGGPALLSTLIVVVVPLDFVLAARLSLLRRIFTPVVLGTVMMLLVVTIMPVVFDMLTAVDDGASLAGAATSAGTSLMLIAALGLWASGAWRLWAPVIGIAAGCAVAAMFGLYDVGPVIEAPWIGLPAYSWPGFDLQFDARFWLLLPTFAFVALIGSMRIAGDAVAIQGVSWRTSRAVDFRAVQGAIKANGLGNLLAGIAGTMPNTTCSSSTPLVELTGVGARSVGVWAGIMLAGLAFLPKATATLLAIPGPVVAAYWTVLMALLFVQGMKLVVQDGLDYRKSMVAGLAFWIGLGFQNDLIFADLLGDGWRILLGNGMATGGLLAIALTLFAGLADPRPRRFKDELDVAALPKVDAFLRAFAARLGWNDASTQRLRAVGEETLLILLPPEDEKGGEKRCLRVRAYGNRGTAELEFAAAVGEENIEDRIMLLGERAELNEGDLSLRLLRHFAGSVRHQQYHDIDIVTVRVEGGR